MRNLLHLQLVELQRHGLPEAQIASRLNRTSAQEAFRELKGYGFPICEVCGDNPVSGSHCSTKKSRTLSVKGEAQELPSVTNASTHLRDTIRTLDLYLENMESLKEILQGDFFLDEGETEESNIREARGGHWHPHPWLVTLIAVSVLERDGNWGHIERLLMDLHPRPTEANRQKLVRYIYGKEVDENGRPKRDKNGYWKDEGDGLLYRAKQIATLIRGAPMVRTGPKSPSITSLDQAEAWRIRLLIEQGLSQAKITKSEQEKFERDRAASKQSVLKELELAKQTFSEEEFALESRSAHEGLRELAEENWNRDDFIRQYNLARSLK